MNSSYGVTDSLHAPKLIRSFNMHELNIIDEGRTALAIMVKNVWADLSDLDLDEEESDGQLLSPGLEVRLSLI